MSEATTGLERCLTSPPAILRGRRFGLLMNQASVDRHFRYACDLLAELYPGQLATIFTPQHGLWGEQQANMIESPHDTYQPLGIPVYSLYSETRRPTADMLRGIECFVVDLADVGTRVYTFAWTIQQCLHACAAAQIPVVILDRPNPLGRTVEGPLLEPGYESFVGGATIPLRHGLTLGELALLMNGEQRIGAELVVVGSRRVGPAPGADAKRRSASAGPPAIDVAIPVGRRVSSRRLSHPTDDLGVPPSPNIPRLETALVYPGQVLLEGTNLSQGRGTTRPFEVCGAPFIDPFALVSELESYPHPGLALRSIRFVPSFDKWAGQSCGGVALHVVDPAAVRSVAFTVSRLSVIKQLYPRDFAWLPPPYEYEHKKMPIDILFGSARLRERLDQGVPATAEDTASLTAVDEPAWQRRTAPFRLDS
jgi:uncharacterized protein YbbC (DUF1343 family)